MIWIKPLSVAYLERNSICNFHKMVLGYMKTAIDLPSPFQNNHRRLGNSYYAKQLLAQTRQNRDLYSDSGYRAEENSEEPLSESTINSFDFGPHPTVNRWRTLHMVA